MNSDSFNKDFQKFQEEGITDSGITKKIEDAYKVYKISEVFLRDVERDHGKDYGKLKIARLRLDFAQHELLEVLSEARKKGVKLNDNDVIKKFFYPNTYSSDIKDFLI